MKPHHVATEPLRAKRDITKIKEKLKGSARDFALFTMGTNTAFRGGDLLALNVGDVRSLKAGDTLIRKEQKTGKKRMVTLNAAVIEALQPLLDAPDDAPLFRGEKRGTRLTIETLGRLTKRWCEQAGLEGSFSSHTLRKTWATQAYKGGADLVLIQRALNHSSPVQTLAYIGIQAKDLADLYMKEI